MDPLLQRLIDESAIRQLLARYSRAIDRGDMDLLRTCYHPDALDEHGWYDGDIDGFVEFLEGRPEPAFQTHFLGNQLIEIEGDSAWVESYCIAFSRRADGELEDRTQHVRYLDRIEKRDGEWRIAHRVVSYGAGRFDRVEKPTELTQAHVRDRRDRDDRAYRIRSL